MMDIMLIMKSLEKMMGVVMRMRVNMRMFRIRVERRKSRKRRKRRKRRVDMMMDIMLIMKRIQKII